MPLPHECRRLNLMLEHRILAVGGGQALDVFHLRSTALPSLPMRDTEAWRPAAVDPNDPGLLDGLGLRWALKEKQDLGERMKRKEGVCLPHTQTGACVSVP